MKRFTLVIQITSITFSVCYVKIKRAPGPATSSSHGCPAPLLTQKASITSRWDQTWGKCQIFHCDKLEFLSCSISTRLLVVADRGRSIWRELTNVVTARGWATNSKNPTEEWILLVEEEEWKDFNYVTYNSHNSINSQHKLLNDMCKMFTNE